MEVKKYDFPALKRASNRKNYKRDGPWKMDLWKRRLEIKEVDRNVILRALKRASRRRIHEKGAHK